MGLLPEPARRPSGFRDYDQSDIERLRFVRLARSLELPLDDIREILALRDRGEAPCPYVREMIAREADAIEERIGQLVTLRAELLRLHQLATELPDDPPGETGVCPILEHANVEASN